MSTPAWDLKSEYPSIESEKFKQHEMQVNKLADQIMDWTAQLRENIDVNLIEQVLLAKEEMQTLARDLSGFVSCSLAIDGTNEKLKAKQSQLLSLDSKCNQALAWIKIFIQRCDDDRFQEIFSKPSLSSQKFLWIQERKQKDFLLSESEESLISALGASGFHSWANLYSELCSSMKVSIPRDQGFEQVGLAHASALIRGADPIKRQQAWKAIQSAWKTHQHSAAAILNALAGWRLELNKKRSHTQNQDFLMPSLFQSRIEKKTLEAMMTAIKANLPQLRKAVIFMGKAHGGEKLHPWDLLAPAPTKAVVQDSEGMPYKDAISIIRKSFHEVSPSMSSFVDLMVRENRLEGRVLPSKANGGFCSTFRKSRASFIFQTYMGSSRDVFTLAHELGHAYHSWCLKEVPLSETFYPMTLAETASIFAETLLSENLIEQSHDIEQKKELMFINLEQASSLLINIPARFEFEKNFYELRKTKTLSADELSDLTDKAWSSWYGSTLSENDRMYWASKLHFSMSGVSFYNYPYTFGYLFALSIYARKSEWGADFHKRYVEILKDTGRMTAEALIQKHLGENIQDESFWQKAIEIPLNQIKDYEMLFAK